MKSVKLVSYGNNLDSTGPNSPKYINFSILIYDVFTFRPGQLVHFDHPRLPSLTYQPSLIVNPFGPLNPHFQSEYSGSLICCRTVRSRAFVRLELGQGMFAHLWFKVWLYGATTINFNCNKFSITVNHINQFSYFLIFWRCSQ